MPNGRDTRDIVEYIDGSKLFRVTDNYSLYIRLYTLDDISRLQSSNLSTELIYYIYHNEVEGLTGDIEVNGGSMLELDEDGQSGIYVIQLKHLFEVEKEN